MSAETDEEHRRRNGREARLSLRRHTHGTFSRPFPWLGYAFASINLIAIAFFVFDAPLGQAVGSLSPTLVLAAGRITDIGTLAAMLFLTGAVVAGCLLLAARSADARRPFRLVHAGYIAGYLLATLLSTSLAVHVLKYAIGRVRPQLFGEYGVLGFEPLHGGFLFQSFPSAHAAHVGCLFMALALLVPRFRLIFAGVALWLALTRVIIGVHYPSDVIAGLLLGGWFAILIARVFARHGRLFFIAADGRPTPRLRQPFRRRGFVTQL